MQTVKVEAPKGDDVFDSSVVTGDDAMDTTGT